MATKRTMANEVDKYIAGFPESTQKLLDQMRAIILKAVPNVEEIISYKMPAYRYFGRPIYFAGYAKHIGLYPGTASIEAFKKEIAVYKWAKGSVQFPLDKPLPVKLITRMIQFKINEDKIRSEMKKKK